MTLIQTEPKKIYIRVDEQWWQPWANTIAYWKLNWNYNDEMGNFNGTSSHSWNGWATLPGSSDQYLTVNMTWSWDRYAYKISNNLWSAIGSTQNDLTFNRWRYFNSQYSWTSNFEMCHIVWSGSYRVIRAWYWWEFNSWNGWVYLGTWNGGYNYGWYITTISTSTWHNMIFTYNKTTRVKSYYVDGTLIGTTTSSLDYSTSTGQNKANIFWCNWSSSLVWWWSNFIIESTARTATEVSNYYNATKSLYWIN